MLRWCPLDNGAAATAEYACQVQYVRVSQYRYVYSVPYVWHSYVYLYMYMDVCMYVSIYEEGCMFVCVHGI